MKKTLFVVLFLLIATFSAFSQTNSKIPQKMKVQDLFVLLCTDKLIECRDFYVKHFGFEVVFQSTIYIQLSIKSDSGTAFSLA